MYNSFGKCLFGKENEFFSVEYLAALIKLTITIALCEFRGRV